MSDIENISTCLQMRIAQIRKMDVSNGEGLGVSIFTSGCSYHCKNCFNSTLWDYSVGEIWEQKHENLVVSLCKKDYIKRFSMLGGEPLIERNIEPLTKLCKRLKTEKPSIKIWCYTGGLYEEQMKRKNVVELFKFVDVLVDGPYIEDLKDYRLLWRGSSNQRVLRLTK